MCFFSLGDHVMLQSVYTICPSSASYFATCRHRCFMWRGSKRDHEEVPSVMYTFLDGLGRSLPTSSPPGTWTKRYPCPVSSRSLVVALLVSCSHTNFLLNPRKTWLRNNLNKQKLLSLFFSFLCFIFIVPPFARVDQWKMVRICRSLEEWSRSYSCLQSRVLQIK